MEQAPAATPPSATPQAPAPPAVPAAQLALPVTVAQPVTPQPAPPPAAPQTSSAPDPAEVLRRSLVRAEVMRVAERVGAVDTDTVHALVAGQYTVADDGRVVVVSSPQQSVEEHLRAYLATKPYLLRPLAAPGGSPAAATVQPPAGPPPVDLTTSNGLTDYARRRAVALGLRR